MNRCVRSQPRSPATARPQSGSNWCCRRPASAAGRSRQMPAIAAAALHYRMLTRVAWRMRKQSRTARRDAVARPSRRGVNGISLEGRSVIVAMCVGQLGSLLPHVVVPSILAAFLIPEWHLSGAQAGLLAGSGVSATMAMHSTVGFSLSALGAWAVGGPQSSSAWMAAFSVLAAGILLGPLALYWSRREMPQ
jgi:hypothetical protein